MKKLFSIFCALFFLPLFALGNFDDDVWSYVFHLEYAAGTITVASGEDGGYSPVPMLFTESADPAQSPFYGEVVSLRGKKLATFAIVAPTSTVLVTGKSPFKANAPYFADADHVGFYTHSGKHLFDISVKGSSFCNDDNKCNAAVGENYNNCPLDCPRPTIVLSTPTPEPTAEEPVVSPAPLPPSPEAQPEVATPTQTTDTSYVTTSGGTPMSRAFDTKTILSFVGGILVLIVAFFLRKIGKNME